MKIFFKAFLCLLFFASIFLTIPVFQAAGQATGEGLVPCNGPNCTVCHLFKLIVNITEFLFKQVALPLAGLLFLIGGIMMISAGGVESRYKKGKDILINTLIGLVIVLAAFAIVNTLMMFFATGEISINWSKACL